MNLLLEKQFVEKASWQLTSVLDPMGLPHGPQPGKIEESLGAKETNELAVMIDTFKPLNMTEAALNVDDEDYPYSWIES